MAAAPVTVAPAAAFAPAVPKRERRAGQVAMVATAAPVAKTMVHRSNNTGSKTFLRWRLYSTIRSVALVAVTNIAGQVGFGFDLNSGGGVGWQEIYHSAVIQFVNRM
jgi:hypothetical protein